MPDREKVLHELDHQVADADWCDNEWKDNVPIWMLRGALALLRKKEPVAPFHVCTDGLYPRTLVTNKHFVFCPYCGREIKWDA